ncbi:hypothetical protein NWE55_00835 [Myroides albus]|uniref:beta strand repeat-containing protein n=1 Tax=Myroides albus TaxID=2562892 RepID=UPI002159941E|nr:hypothetical protein [Myroides albus]UVD79869.1 hypothetical protein NWE55_00835 [Myroides albus]
MKKRWILLSAFCASAISHAQVGIGTATPNPSSQLEISSDKRGILIPQVRLKNLTDNKTISNGNVESLLVYNTAASEQLQPGYYFWKQNTWTRLLTEIDDKVVDFPIISKFVVEEELLKLYDTHNNFVVIDLEKLNVITTLVKDASGNGKYTYKNEAGAEVVIDVQADVISNFETIINNTDVQDIINNIIKTVGGNVYYDGSSFTYITEDGDTVSLDISSVVKANETLTTLVKDASGNGQYTYTNEAGTPVVIDVKADVISNFETIINTTEVQDIINNIIKTVGGNVYYDGSSFTYINEDGDTVSLDISSVVKANETLTTLVKDASGNGQYTYTNEAGTPVVIDVKADVISNFETIINTTEVQDIINNIIKTVGGNVYYDGSSFTYINEDGDTVSLDISSVVKANETLTTLVKDASGNGQYTYTNEAGTPVVIDVKADVISNFETIINTTEVQDIINNIIKTVGGNVYYDGSSFTYINEDGDTVSLDISSVVKANETLTTLVKDASGNGQYTYTNEAGTPVVIDVKADVISNFETIINTTEVQDIINNIIKTVGGNVYYDGSSFTYINEDGDTVSLDISSVVKANETLTTLVKDASGNGQYTYTNEAGTPVVIDVKADVISNFETIINTTEVQDIINNIIKTVGGNVYYDGSSFTYINEDGDTVSLDISSVVKANETLTTLVKDASGNGQYTYTNEAGTPVVIDVKADVISNFETIINTTEVQDIINNIIKTVGGNVYYDGSSFTYINEDGDTVSLDISSVVKANETLTTLVKDASGNGQYTYTNEAGTPVVIDVKADVISNFETIINTTEVQDIINNIIKTVGGNVYYDGSSFTYINEDGDTVSLDISSVVKANETLTTLVKDASGNGQYTYTNEAGTPVVIDVKADVISNFETIINTTEVQDIINNIIKTVGGNVYYDGSSFTYINEDGDTVSLDISSVVKANETLTTLVKDASGNGQYTYTNEAGTPVVIDVKADVISNFETIINTTEVQDIINNIIKTVGGNVYYDGSSFTYINEDGDTVSLDISSVVKANETLTTLVKDASGNGQYTYTNEAGTPVVIDVKADVISNFETIINTTEVQDIINNIIKTVGGNVYYDGSSFTYINEDGDTVSLDISSVVKANETLTTLVKDASGNGQYTYTNEAGTPVVIDVKADVISNFETIINTTEVQDIINNIIKTVGGNVYYDGSSFTYINEDGDTVSLDISSVVKANETLTTLVKDASGNGQYTYTNEAGTPVVIDVKADVISNFETIINTTEVQDIINNIIKTVGGNVYYDGSSFTYINEDGDTVSLDISSVVKANETLTTLVKDASGNGQYTYTNEAGTPVVIDVKADVISNFETIINTTEVQDIINNIIKTVGGNVYYDGSSFTYINEDGDTVSLDISSVVKANETLTTLVNVNDVFTYTSENSTATEINIPSLVKGHETLTTLENVKTQETEESGEVIDIYTLTYKDENGNLNPIDIKVLVKGSETLTTLVYDPIAHVLTYTNEKGEETILKLTDLVGDGESLTKLEFDASTNSLLYTDEKQIIHTIDLETINKHPWYDSATQKVATSNTSDIYTRGWVGIGFTEPSNAPNEKLRVNGSITAVNSYYADYVFENYFDGYSALKYDYKFKELDDIADFIRENRHLPGITPIHELKKTEEGYAINVSELSVQLLEKTEELYLHMIEQNNELEQKEARIKELETLNREVLKKINLLEEKETKINELEMINKMFYQKLEQLEQELLELKSKN